jgi:putative peptidoglycan lipid II flippase
VVLGAVGAAIVGTVCLAVYAGVLALVRAPELTPAITMVRRVLPGGRRGD